MSDNKIKVEMVSEQEGIWFHVYKDGFIKKCFFAGDGLEEAVKSKAIEYAHNLKKGVTTKTILEL